MARNVAEIDADVRLLPAILVEEQLVAAPQLRQRNGRRRIMLRFGAARQLHARLPEAELHQPAAVEARGRRAAIAIRPPDHLQRLAGRAVGGFRGHVSYALGRGGARGEQPKDRNEAQTVEHSPKRIAALGKRRL